MYCGLKISSTTSIGPRKQKGAVLVVGMILLLILMIGAVTMMNSSVQDEKMTGNARRSVDALMAAEAGMQRALTEMDEERWYDYTCADFVDGSAVFLSGDSHIDGKSSYVLTYVTDSCQVSSDPDELNPNLITALRLVSTGLVTNTNAERQIEFELRHTGGPSWPAIYLNDDGSCTYVSAGSETFAIDGSGGAALGANSPECAKAANDSAEAKGALSNHVGGIHNLLFDSDFTTPEGLREFYEKVTALDNADNAAVTGTTDDPDKVYVGPQLSTSTKAPETMGSPDENDDGVPDDMRVTVIEGDMKFGGNDYGAGLLIVKGDVEFGGTPNWDGMMIILGDVTVKGGGGTNPAKEGFNGTMLVTKIDDFDDNPWVYSEDPVTYRHQAGGGSASYTFDCDMLLETKDMLAGMPGVSASDLFPVDCTGGSGGPMGRAYIHEWYEVVNE